jgi:hypothetical protein
MNNEYSISTTWNLGEATNGAARLFLDADVVVGTLVIIRVAVG